ncbi:MAG: hypothetical protein FJW23_09570, partial [Acidimicrobiia bacterium]|nr:hypothetical protein [Acidimicrobiia bacterium]
MTRPSPIPGPDRRQIDALNRLYLIRADDPDRPGFRGRLIGTLRRFILRLIGPLVTRQQDFNTALVDHLNRADRVASEAHDASARMLAWTDQTFGELHAHLEDRWGDMEQRLAGVERLADEVRRRHEALVTGELRSQAVVERLAGAHEELKASVGVLNVATQSLRREIERASAASPPAAAPAHAAAPAP